MCIRVTWFVKVKQRCVGGGVTSDKMHSSASLETSSSYAFSRAVSLCTAERSIHGQSRDRQRMGLKYSTTYIDGDIYVFIR